MLTKVRKSIKYGQVLNMAVGYVILYFKLLFLFLYCLKSANYFYYILF